MPDLAEAFSQLDARITETKALVEGRMKSKSPCASGCSHCCFEPVFAERGEVEFIVKNLSSVKRDDLTHKTRLWAETFWSSGLGEIDFNSQDRGFAALLKYRSLRLNCPLLENALCTEYAIRPSGCRTHVALKGASRCARDDLRPTQKFLSVHGAASGMAFVFSAIAGNSRTYFFHFDHLGIWLSHFLLGENRHSASSSGSMVTQTDPNPTLELSQLRA